MKLPFEGPFKDKYAGRSPERILCLYSVRLVFSLFYLFSYLLELAQKREKEGNKEKCEKKNKERKERKKNQRKKVPKRKTSPTEFRHKMRSGDLPAYLFLRWYLKR